MKWYVNTMTTSLEVTADYWQVKEPLVCFYKHDKDEPIMVFTIHNLVSIEEGVPVLKAVET